MADTGSNTGLWASIVAALPGLGALGWAIFKQTDNASHAIVVSEQAEEHKAESARSLLDDVQKEWFDGMRQDLRDTRTENATLRKDRDRGWDLARAWRQLARDERHARANLMQRFNDTESLDPLPGLEDIEGRRP